MAKGKGKGKAGKQARKGKPGPAMPEFMAAVLVRNKVVVDTYDKAIAFSVTFDPPEDAEIITANATLTAELTELLEIMVVNGTRLPVRHDNMIGYPSEELWKTARKVVFLKNGSPMALRQLPNSTEPSQLSIRIRLLKPHTTNPNETITGYNAAVARSVQPDTSTRNENIAGFNDALASSADLEQPPLAKSASGKGRRKRSATQDAEKKLGAKAKTEAAEVQSNPATPQVAMDEDRPSHKELKQAARKLPPAEQVKHLYTEIANMGSVHDADSRTDGGNKRKGKRQKRAPSSTGGSAAAAPSRVDDAGTPDLNNSPRHTRSGTVIDRQSTSSKGGSKDCSILAAKTPKTPTQRLSAKSSVQSQASTWEGNDENRLDEEGENGVAGMDEGEPAEEPAEEPDTPMSPPLTRSQQVYQALVTTPIKAVGRMLGF